MPAGNISSEVKAMSVIEQTLEGLFETERNRVLAWLDLRYAISGPVEPTRNVRAVDNPEAYAS